ncbi:MAG: 4-alpha-glucanotransferase [Acholeplasmataceae bacterium]
MDPDRQRCGCRKRCRPARTPRSDRTKSGGKDMRRSGILMHVSSLPSPYGIGTFGKKAYDFVDFLIETKQTYWQILPIGPTSYGDSPYQTFSAFAYNPYFIDLDFLVRDGLLAKDEILSSHSTDRYVDYGKLYEERFLVLEKAFERFDPSDADYARFLEANSFWLDDYCLFMALKNERKGASWISWEKPLRMRKESALAKARRDLKESIAFHRFLQYIAATQWQTLKAYANGHGVSIIGDMPIYVSYDSSDVWANPSLFDLDDELVPNHIAGVPPDSFSDDGQVWGNPLYDWDLMAERDYAWWVERLRSASELFDRVRIDHFIGFQNYFSIEYGAKTAKDGVWHKGPGIELFRAIKKELGDVDIIAEDLGVVTEDVKRLREKAGFPGMKLLQFAFDAREESDYLPHCYTRDTVVYTGTHDNETSKSWLEHLPKRDRKYCLDYINHTGKNPVDSLIKATLLSVSDTAIIPIQDYLNLGEEGRMNHPSTLGNNWRWRLVESDLTTGVKKKIRYFTELYGRDPMQRRRRERHDTIDKR